MTSARAVVAATQLAIGESLLANLALIPIGAVSV